VFVHSPDDTHPAVKLNSIREHVAHGLLIDTHVSLRAVNAGVPKELGNVSPVVASTLLANVRRPEWLEPPLIPARWYSLVTCACSESHAR